MKTINAWINFTNIGNLIDAKTSTYPLKFTYHKNYIQNINTPLSISMPLSDTEYDDNIIFPYLLGLLPDNPNKLRELEIRKHIENGDTFSLISQIGIDCPGAVSFVESMNDVNVGKLVAINDVEIENRLKLIRNDSSRVELDAEENYSLGGFQSKFALRKMDGIYYKANGLEPTTHILKPGLRPNEFEDQALIEHICTSLAKQIGLNAQTTHFRHFGKEPAIILTRFDRALTNGKVTKFHQEDFCQALSIIPSMKYEKDGGPSIVKMFNLLDRNGQHHQERQENKISLLDGIIFNYLIVGTDAHAKNYSLLLEKDSVRLAPLYDIASFAPYYNLDIAKYQYALKFGKSRYYRKLDEEDFSILSAETGLDKILIHNRVLEISNLIQRNIENVTAQYINSKTVQLLRKKVNEFCNFACSGLVNHA